MFQFQVFLRFRSNEIANSLGFIPIHFFLRKNNILKEKKVPQENKNPTKKMTGNVFTKNQIVHLHAL